jgi:hypothetical protein
MGKKLNIIVGVVIGFVALLFLVAAFGPRDESGKLEYIGGSPSKLNSSGLTPEQVVSQDGQEQVSFVEDTTSISNAEGTHPVDPEFAEINYAMDLMISNCVQGNGVDMNVCDADIKRNYDFFCMRHGDAMIDTCLKALDYLTSRGVI